MPIRRGVSERLYSVLRRIMEECLPAGEHIQTEGGVYRWVSKSVSVYVDARDFQATAEKGLEKENEEELLRACGLYQGEFLAQLAGEKWVTIVSVRCQELISAACAASAVRCRKTENTSPF